jgi:hypothetical protein
VKIGRPTLRVHDLRHTYASVARRAGADLRLLQKTMGHASITVTAHIYVDLYDDELDDVASALDALFLTTGTSTTSRILASFCPYKAPTNCPTRGRSSAKSGL